MAAAAAAAAVAAAAEAIRFCHATPSARVACVWPTGHTQLDTARSFIQQQGGELVHEASVALADHAHVLLVMALYHGEDWLASNCYYYESPLPGGPPSGPFAGARWKEELAFRPAAVSCTCISRARGGVTVELASMRTAHWHPAASSSTPQQQQPELCTLPQTVL